MRGPWPMFMNVMYRPACENFDHDYPNVRNAAPGPRQQDHPEVIPARLKDSGSPYARKKNHQVWHAPVIDIGSSRSIPFPRVDTLKIAPCPHDSFLQVTPRCYRSG